MRPPVRWIRSADQRAWLTAIVWRVARSPGRRSASQMGTADRGVPSKSARYTWGCTEAWEPLQVWGESPVARPSATTHWNAMSAANMRSVRTCTARLALLTSS